MTDVNFYQLAAKPLDAVLPRLLEKAVAVGYRTVIRAADPALLARLDAALWAYDPASFLPHAVDGEHAAAQPILLTTRDGAANAADLLVVVDGVVPGDLTAYRRALYLFDGGDETARGLARYHWKAIRELDGVTPIYWRENERGGWEQAG